MTVTEELPPVGPTGPPPDGPTGPPPDGVEPPRGVEPPPMRRSRTKRLVAGVCGGLSDRFDVDVTIVRVAFVVVACLWGVGVVLYLALWALLPVVGGDDMDVAEGDGTPAATATGRPSWMAYVLLAGALFLGLMISSTWWGGPRWGGGLGLGWLLVLFAVVVVALNRPTRRPSFGRVLLTLALILLSVVILLTGAFFGAVATTGVPLSGGIGQRVVQPTAPSQLHSVYRLAIGSMTVDLTHVPLGTTRHTVTASVGVGQLVVDVPRGAVVDVDATSGIGNVSYGASGPTGFAAPITAFGQARPQLVIDAQVGIGHIQLLRGGS